MRFGGGQRSEFERILDFMQMRMSIAPGVHGVSAFIQHGAGKYGKARGMLRMNGGYKGEQERTQLLKKIGQEKASFQIKKRSDCQQSGCAAAGIK